MDTCTPTGCERALDDELCDDEVECTINTCAPTGCERTLDDDACDDDVDCTLDTCTPTGCERTLDDDACDDDVECTLDSCTLTGCEHESRAVFCDDGVDCTEDTCEPTGCVSSPDDGRCPLFYDTCDSEYGCAFVIWVEDGCLRCGEGTEDEPYEMINEALSVTRDSDEATLNVVHVAAGDYDEDEYEYNQDSRPLVIAGEPGVTWTSPENRALIVSNEARVTLRRLTMSAKQTPLECTDSAICSLDRVVLRDGSIYGLLAVGDVTVTLDRCLVQGNLKAGMRLKNRSKVSLVNSLVVGNGGAGAEAGAVYIEHSDVDFSAINCTFADNEGGSRPSAIRAPGGLAMRLVNVILWHAGSPASACPGCTFTTSLGGSHNPQFVKSSRRDLPEDYMLRAGSPAIDEGSGGEGVPTVDYWGELRDESVDIGVHEYVP